jgi:hypothetical protein
MRHRNLMMVREKLRGSFFAVADHQESHKFDGEYFCFETHIDQAKPDDFQTENDAKAEEEVIDFEEKKEGDSTLKNQISNLLSGLADDFARWNSLLPHLAISHAFGLSAK